MTAEQRRALENSIPTTLVVRDAVTFPRERLGEPLDISGEKFDAWLDGVKREAAREALDGLAEKERELHSRDPEAYKECLHASQSAIGYRDTHYPEETP